MFIINKISKIRHNYIWNNKIVSYSFFINLFLCIAFFGIIGFLSYKRNDIVPLSYNIYYGSSNFGSIKNFFIFPIIGFIVFIINYILCYFYYKYNRILSYFLISTALAAIVFMILSFILLILFIEL